MALATRHVVDDPLGCIASGCRGKVNRQTVRSCDRREVVVLVEHLLKCLYVGGLAVLISGFGNNALEKHFTRSEQLDEQDGASRALIGQNDVSDVLFVPRRENEGVDQVNVLVSRSRHKIASETPNDTPERVAPERQYLHHGVDRDVVVEDFVRETVCDRSRNRQLSNSRRAVEEHETWAGHASKYAGKRR